MDINSISSTTTSQLVISEKKDKNDLQEQMDDSLKKDVKYQIIDKILQNKEQDEKSLKEKQTFKTQDAQSYSAVDQVNLSSQAFTIAAENRADNSGFNVQSSEMNSSRSLTINSEAVQAPKQSDPLILDLKGDGITTTGVDKGVSFDINADGIMDKSSFVKDDNVFLAYDKNGNGIIDNGSELFGDQNGAANGYEELSKYDDNLDGKIDHQDEIFNKLQLLGLNRNHQQQLSSLSDSNIDSISTAYNNTQQAINQYDTISQTGRYTRQDGSQGKTADVLLGYI